MTNDWIEWTWTEEKPYPETLETLVFVKDNTGYDEEELDYDPSTVEFWHIGHSSWKPSDEDGEVITHYKLA